MALNNSHLLPLLVSVGQEFASSLLDVLAQSLSHGCSEMSAGAAVILSLIAAGGFVSRVAHSHGWQTGAGCALIFTALF